jgi:hypothetical protein
MTAHETERPDLDPADDDEQFDDDAERDDEPEASFQEDEDVETEDVDTEEEADVPAKAELQRTEDVEDGEEAEVPTEAELQETEEVDEEEAPPEAELHEIEDIEAGDAERDEGESVLLTETEPGSVLPPEEEQVADEAAPSPLERLEPVGPDTPVDPGTGDYQERWSAIQTGFIDDPRRSVESASSLLVEMWESIERSIGEERQGIDSRWQESERSTDELRLAMQSYRDLYNRLVTFTPRYG